MDIIDEFIELSIELCGIRKSDALRLECELRKIHGGSTDNYIRKTLSSTQEKRQQAVWEAQRTGRVSEAAKKYGVNRGTIYRLLAQARMLRSEKP